MKKQTTHATGPEGHALRIARQQMREACVMVRVLGGSHVEAAATIERLTGRRPPLPQGCGCARPK